MPLSRRDFLTASSLMTCGACAPSFWQRVARAAPAADQAGARDTILVVIELTGGNDGLNTAIPIQDPAYAAARPTLKQPRDKVLRVSDELALHPALGGFARLLEQSQLAIVQGVGYPNPNRSHFVSMDFWHTATLKENEPNGWLGMAIAQAKEGPGGLYAGSGDLPRALVGPAGRTISLKSIADYRLKSGPSGDDPERRKLIEGFAARQPAAPNGLLDLVRQTARETYHSTDRLHRLGASYDTPVPYPASGLGTRLKLIAQVIAAGMPERLFYTSLGGFDTHSDQAKQHAALLQELGDAVSAFQQDIAHHGQQQRVLTVTFSEFGRRVKENGSLGTDHGAASQMFVIGEKVRPGPIGAHPSVTDLVDGDLKHHTDFRSVYATLLEQWLRIPARSVLGDEYPTVPLLRTA